MVGTTFKLAFDAQSVKRGISSLGGMMKSFGKQVAIGGSREVGVKMTDFLGRMISYLPEAAKETLDWAGDLVDLSNQTRASTKDLMLLGEAFRLSGMESVDAGRMIGTMQKSLYAAGTGDQAQQDALSALGLRPSSFEGMDPIERMKLIIKQMNKLKDTLKPGQLEDVSSAIFGGKIGLKTLRIFENLPATLEEASRNLGTMQDMTTEELSALDNMGDMLGRFEIEKRGLLLSLMEGMFGKNMSTGTTMINSLAGLVQSLRPTMEKIGGIFKGMLDALPKLIDDLAKGGPGKVLGGFLESIGESIGKGMKKTFTESLNPFSDFNNKKPSGKTGDKPLLTETEKHTALLEKMLYKNSIAEFA
jgi:hypothetical protein